MPTGLAEGLFLLAFWAPPLAVVAGALALFVKTPSARHSGAHTHEMPLTH